MSLSGFVVPFLVTIGDIEIPIPEIMFAYILENRTVTVYPENFGIYFSRPIAAFELKKDELLKAQRAYKYVSDHFASKKDRTWFQELLSYVSKALLTIIKKMRKTA